MNLKHPKTQEKLFLAVSTERVCSPACLQNLLNIAEEKIIICNSKGDVLLANLIPSKPNIFTWFTTPEEGKKFEEPLKKHQRLKGFQASLVYDSTPKKVSLNAVLLPETDELIITFSESEILSKLAEQLSHSEKMAAIGQMAGIVMSPIIVACNLKKMTQITHYETKEYVGDVQTGFREGF